MPASSRSTSGTGRRAVLQGALGGAVALALTSCRLRVGAPAPGQPGATSPTDADDALLGTTADQARALQQVYSRAGLVRPDLKVSLDRLAADHHAHLLALTALGADATAPTATGPASAPATDTPTTGSLTSGTATTAPATSFPAPTAATATTVLAAAERSVVTARLAMLGGAGPDAARLIASMAACGSAHVTLLSRLPATAVRPNTSTSKKSTSSQGHG